MHPTNVELPGDVDTINVPTSYGLGDKDMVVKVDMKDKVEEINAKRSNSRTTEFIIHSPGKHGKSCPSMTDERDLQVYRVRRQG